MKESDWQLPLWLVCPYLDIPYLIKSNESHSLPISAIIFFLCFCQVATNFTFNSETSPMLLLLKCLPSSATKKLLVKNAEHRLEEAFSDSLRGDVGLGCFILLSAGISKELPKLTYLYFFSFLNWPLKHNCPFGWQQSGGFEQLPTSECWNLFSGKYQLTKHSSCTLPLAIYPLIFVASIECADSITLNGKNTYCTFF